MKKIQEITMEISKELIKLYLEEEDTSDYSNYQISYFIIRDIR